MTLNDASRVPTAPRPRYWRARACAALVVGLLLLAAPMVAVAADDNGDEDSPTVTPLPVARRTPPPTATVGVAPTARPTPPATPVPPGGTAPRAVTPPPRATPVPTVAKSAATVAAASLQAPAATAQPAPSAKQPVTSASQLVSDVTPPHTPPRPKLSPPTAPIAPAAPGPPPLVSDAPGSGIPSAGIGDGPQLAAIPPVTTLVLDAPSVAGVVVAPVEALAAFDSAVGESSLAATTCLTPGVDPATACRLTPGASVLGYLTWPGATDAYRLDLADDGAWLQATLSDLPADYDLYLVDTAAQIVGQSVQDGTVAESIDMALAAGTYYLYVHADPGGSVAPDEPYRLTVTTAPADTGVTRGESDSAGLP